MFNSLKAAVLYGLAMAAHPTPYPLTPSAPRELTGQTFNPYRKGTAAARREAVKRRNKQRSKK
jgi:hypothetical protein